MTSPSLGRLLISHITLRGPELAQLYALVAGRAEASYDDLVGAFVPPAASESTLGLEEAPLREALNFLLVAGLVEQRGANRRKASFRATPLLADVSFPLLLLHHLSSHPDERQRAPALIYCELVADDVLATTQSALRDQMERGRIRDLFAWTGEKISLWTQLMSYIGLVRRLERSDEVLIVPQMELVRAALRAVAGSPCGTWSLDTLLRDVEVRFFTCFTGRGRVHTGLAQTLVALHRLGSVHLSHSADAARSLLLDEWRVSEVRLVQEVRL